MNVNAKFGNRLLACLGSAARERIDSHFKILNAPAGRILCWTGDHLNHVYFPSGAVLCGTTMLGDGSAIETAVIGCEGAFGLFEAMYTHRTFSQCRAIMAGCLYRVQFQVLRYLFEHDSHVRQLFVTYSLALRAEMERRLPAMPPIPFSKESAAGSLPSRTGPAAGTCPLHMSFWRKSWARAASL